ncbi:uncharacterized protein LOC116141190 isoform X2 [Pistacia vera]|uniref:uncharacterized protein LOC116141190 isoform X2 n=1 Tax=Pistacia vera TaxID=55513 RepID=UPI001262AE3B|nr:uncharacterized protein LOC116141190 isoform X2 [Pistacia vera]
MAICAQCCLHTSIKIVNIITNLFAVGMIVYALWLQKKWTEGIAELPSTAYIPRPWFIYSCLAVGMVVCLSTICGYMVATFISSSILYKLIAEYTSDHNKRFKSFVVFHLKMCQLIIGMILVSQINVIALGMLLWVIGAEPRTTGNNPEMRAVMQSFLVGPSSTSPAESRQICSSCENFLEEYTHESFWSFFKAELRMRFQRTSVS